MCKVVVQYLVLTVLKFLYWNSLVSGFYEPLSKNTCIWVHPYVQKFPKMLNICLLLSLNHLCFSNALSQIPMTIRNEERNLRDQIVPDKMLVAPYKHWAWVFSIWSHRCEGNILLSRVLRTLGIILERKYLKWPVSQVWQLQHVHTVAFMWICKQYFWHLAKD